MTVADEVLAAHTEFEKENPKLKGVTTPKARSRTWKQQLGFILKRPNNYPGIVERFKKKYSLKTLASTPKDLTKDQLKWWKTEIMKRAGKPKGFAHVGGSARDISLGKLSLESKKKLRGFLEKKGFKVFNEQVGKKSKYGVPIQQANVFHVYK